MFQERSTHPLITYDRMKTRIKLISNTFSPNAWQQNFQRIHAFTQFLHNFFFPYHENKPFTIQFS